MCLAIHLAEVSSCLGAPAQDLQHVSHCFVTHSNIENSLRLLLTYTTANIYP